MTPSARNFGCVVILGLVLAPAALPARSQQAPGIIDRLLAVVDGEVVTMGDIEQHRALARLFGDPVPEDEASALDAVIENRLIDRQAAVFPGVNLPDESVEDYMARLPGTGGLPGTVVRDAVRARLERAQYFDLRFRQFIRVSDAEIAAYYADVFVPEARARGLEPIPPLDGVREMIRVNVTAEKARQEIDAWVELLHRRSDIEIVDVE